MQLSIKYRPKAFQDVVGQDTVVRVLMNSILMDRVPKCLLFHGIRGTGKTSVARIYSQALNCHSFKETHDVCGSCDTCSDPTLSYIEIDAASNNGVDYIRDLEQLVKQAISVNRRVIVLDECHYLTPQAQAALLKLLEDAQDYKVSFILVTTNPEKLEDVVRSRCLQVKFQSISPEAAEANLRAILFREGYVASDYVLGQISRVSGSLRDVQQILDQQILGATDNVLSEDYLQQTLGVLPVTTYQQLATFLITKDPRLILETVDNWYRTGVDLELVYASIPVLIKDLMHFVADPSFVYYESGLSQTALARNVNFGYDLLTTVLDNWETMYSIFEAAEYKEKRALLGALFVKICNG